MTIQTHAPFLSIIIPVHNQTTLLKKLIRSILDEPMPLGSIEILVTDDGSASPVVPDQLLDADRISRSAAPSVGVYDADRATSCLRIVRHDSSRGAAAARNTAADAAAGEILLFLDADTILETGSLLRVHDRFQAEPALGAINGGGSMDPANPEDGFTARYRALLDHIQQNRRAPSTCSFFTPRLGAVRKKFFVACGRFDPAFPGASVEEYEFGHRLTRLCPIGFDPEVNVRHHYQRFWKNCRNHFNRVRLWMPLFWKRKKFENFGSVTRSYGFGSGFGFLAAAIAPFVCLSVPAAAGFVACFFLFLAGFAELFLWTIRLKGYVFLVQSVLLSWWLCLFIVTGAVAGTVDTFLGRTPD